MSSCTLVAISRGFGELEDKSAQEIISYVARVSNPQNQNNFPTAKKLLAYCIQNGHWSIFEQASMTIEIRTSRIVSTQLLRHRSFNFQEFSQRYAKVQNYVSFTARRQDSKNRQNSIDDLDDETRVWFNGAQRQTWANSKQMYDEALTRGIAKESARALLPLNTETCIYMTGNIRSWIHYILLRVKDGTQKEHVEVAEKIKTIFVEQFPDIASALGRQGAGETNETRITTGADVSQIASM